MFMCVSLGIETTDKTRIAAQIVSGIGFLGAGVILRDGNKIKGLNTAATLWCVASIGVLSASGLLLEATVGTFLVLFSNILLRSIAQKIMDKSKQNSKEECVIRISCEKDIEATIRTTLTKLIDKNNLNLESLERSTITKDEVKLKTIIITTRIEEVEDIINKLSAIPKVTSISWKHQKYVKTDNEDDEDEDTLESLEESSND